MTLRIMTTNNLDATPKHHEVATVRDFLLCLFPVNCYTTSTSVTCDLIDAVSYELIVACELADAVSYELTDVIS